MRVMVLMRRNEELEDTNACICYYRFWGVTELMYNKYLGLLGLI